MIAAEAIRHIVRSSGLSMREASSRMGMTPNYISSVVRQAERMDADLVSSTLARAAEACGYVLAFVPEGELPEGAVAIDAKGEEA